jgi:CBS domain-containing protein
MRPAVCVAPTTTVRHAIEAMNEHRTGCVLVVYRERLLGVFTERDVLTRIVAKELNLDDICVEEVMTPEPECLTLDDGIAYALNLMSIGGFRHIPLVDQAGHPTGIVSMRDVVDFIVDLFPEAVLNLPPSPSHGIARSREGA